MIEGEEGQKETSMTADYLYEPSRAAIFERLLPKYIEIQIYRALLESSGIRGSCKDGCHGKCDKELF